LYTSRKVFLESRLSLFLFEKNPAGQKFALLFFLNEEEKKYTSITISKTKIFLLAANKFVEYFLFISVLRQSPTKKIFVYALKLISPKGSRLMRLPQAANTALATAGATGGMPGFGW
jgi:hypothetical protein